MSSTPMPGVEGPSASVHKINFISISADVLLITHIKFQFIFMNFFIYNPKEMKQAFQ